MFDEIEKAHSDVFNVLLQILDDGRLSDGQGRVVNFKITIVIMTSNIGTEFFNDSGDGKSLLTSKQAEGRIRDVLKNYFRPEFLNRVDEAVIFNRLTQEDINKIVDIQITILEKRLADKNLSVDLTAAAKEYLGKQGFDPVYGARPLKRVIQKQVQDPIALMMLKGEVKEGDNIKVDISKKAEGLVFSKR